MNPGKQVIGVLFKFIAILILGLAVLYAGNIVKLAIVVAISCYAFGWYFQKPQNQAAGIGASPKGDVE